MCIWWDWKRVFYYELSIKPINCKYCSQLDTLKVALDEKHSELIIIKCILSHQFNAMTRQKWLQFGWEVLIHPSYSPTLQLQMPIYFRLYNILLMEKNCIPSVSSVQSLSHVQLFGSPWTAAFQASLSITKVPEFTQTHVHWVGDAIQPSHPLSSPSPPAFNLFQNWGLFKWISSSHQVAKILEFHLQHQCFQWTFRTDSL